MRGWGGKYARLDTHMKAGCIWSVLDAKQWKFSLFPDMKFEHNGIREYHTKNNKWTLIVQGKVGIALDARWTEEWRNSGAKVTFPGKPDNKDNRCMGRGDTENLS